MSLLLGIDLGSTSLKAVVYDLKGNVVAQSSRPTKSHNPDPEHPDWSVWMPDEIWKDTSDAIREAMNKLPDKTAVKAAAVTGMGMDGIPIDKDGDWLYPFINWRCPRTVPQQKWWLDHIGAEKQFALTGNPVWPINSALRMLWVKQNKPEVLEKTSTWLLIEDFVNFKLTGVRATDYSMASNTLFFQQKTRDYSDELLQLSGIPHHILPEPKPSGTIIGEVAGAAAEATGLAPGTPVVLGGHDFLCACLPVGAFKPGVVQDVIGTWEIIVAAFSDPVLTDEVRDMGWWIDSHVARNTHAAMGSAVAADMLEWFRKEFGRAETAENDESWEALLSIAEKSPAGANGVLFLPHFSGSTIPVIDGDSKGAFAGLGNITTRGDMLRAIIEGLNYQFLQIVEGLEQALHVKPEKFVAVGGGAKNRLWMQTKADTVGRPFEIPDIEEATPLGAAILAGIGAGLYRNEEEAFQNVYKPGTMYEPDTSMTPFYRERFEVFKTLYPALAPVHHKLST